jgi:DNA polymerase-3 subunit epsilon
VTFPWADSGLISFDTETTGVDPTTARIVTASVIYLAPGQQPTVREWLADPGIDIPAEATAVHKISTEHARAHGRPHDEVLADVIGALHGFLLAGNPLVVFNAPYDLTLLERRARDAGQDTLHDLAASSGDPVHVIDPLVIDRKMDRYRRGGRKLTTLCQDVYAVALSDAEAHGSTADALAAARVAWKQSRRYPTVGMLTAAELHARQVAWYAQDRAEFRAYLRKQGKPVDDVRDGWPIHTSDPVADVQDPGQAPLFGQPTETPRSGPGLL